MLASHNQNPHGMHSGLQEHVPASVTSDTSDTSKRCQKCPPHTLPQKQPAGRQHSSITHCRADNPTSSVTRHGVSLT